jgi:hypothetical protein
MTTYSFIKYDVLKDLMYFKSTPTPDFKQTVKTEGISTEQDREYIEGIQSSYNNLVPQEASDYIKTYLQGVPGLDLNNSKSINLRIAINDNNTVGEILIISQNLNRTITTISVPNNNWLESKIELIKPVIKFPTLGKCLNCLKFDFLTGSNDYNFYGSLGGEWTGQYINNQKEYRFFLPDFSSALNYGATTEYRVRWRPNASYTGNDYDGNPISFTNQRRWVATPVSQINLPLNTSSFFHITPGNSASCPYYNDTPLTPPWYNFLGEKGYFLTSLANQLPDKPCPTFSPIPGEVDWGWNCGPNGCVPSPSGSIGTYATLAQCQVSCSVTPTQSFEYICTLNGCVQAPSGSGGFATLAECQAICIPLSPTECNCTGNLVSISNSNFSSGFNSWVYSPNPFLPGVGGWNLVSNRARATAQEIFNSVNTSSVYLSQLNVFNVSCSYEICFQAWSGTPGVTSSFVSIDTGNYTTNLPVVTTPLTTTPTAYTLTISNIQTPDLTFFVASTGDKIFIDNVCVKQTYCPPLPEPEDCIITGSAYCYTDTEYDCVCPEGYISDGNGNCVGSGSLTISASAGIISSLNTTNGDIIPGFSINQPIPPYVVDFNNVAGYIPAYAGMAQPNLYYQWNFNGTGDSSLNNTSSFSGSSYVYNTQYTFDVLSSSFWYQPELGQNWTSRWVTQLCRQTTVGIPQNNGINDRWSGFGTTLNVPSPKTYYVGIIGQGAMKIKLDGTTILCTSPTETNTPNYDAINYPAYAQNGHARYPNAPFSFYNWGTLPAPFYSLNTHITSPISSAYFDWYFQDLGPEYANFEPTVYNSPSAGKFLSGYNLYIYPVTMSAGCHKINFEANPDYFKYCQSNQGFLGAVILDNTAEQLVSASSYSDLNIVWDSTYLDPITSSFYLYSYPVTSSLPTSSYSSWCPTGSTPVGGEPCNGCFTTESMITSVPCGNCIECTHGLLYNGYIVDAGGPIYAGRGTAGLVNTSSFDNPINTWKIPENDDWYDLVTFINNSIPPSSITPVGSYGVQIGGKLKDYTRDLIATCWGFPNVGAQTDDFSSGWNGVAGGIRNDIGTFSKLLLEGYWWTANSTISSAPLKLAAVNLRNYSNEIYRDNLYKSNGCSVRLVRPAEPGETSGDVILNAYIGNDGTRYNGIVLGTQVWITVNLSETRYNDGSTIIIQPDTNIWEDTLTTADKFSCYYDNQYINVSLPRGNIDPVTGLCYEYPKLYVYRRCDGKGFLAQTEPGAVTSPGEVQRADDLSCWEFFAEYNSSPDIIFTQYYTGNYFANNPTIYVDCEECNATHTIYMTFDTKNC